MQYNVFFFTLKHRTQRKKLRIPYAESIPIEINRVQTRFDKELQERFLFLLFLSALKQSESLTVNCM